MLLVQHIRHNKQHGTTLHHRMIWEILLMPQSSLFLWLKVLGKKRALLENYLAGQEPWLGGAVLILSYLGSFYIFLRVLLIKFFSFSPLHLFIFSKHSCFDEFLFFLQRMCVHLLSREHIMRRLDPWETHSVHSPVSKPLIFLEMLWNPLLSVDFIFLYCMWFETLKKICSNFTITFAYLASEMDYLWISACKKFEKNQ